jgi:hypothetical protein
MFTVALLALAVAGCTTTGTPTARPTDTTPSAIPTQTQPTATPSPKPFLAGYTEHLEGGKQGLPGQQVPQVTCTFEAVYNNSDWTMPSELKTLYGYSTHGVIYKLLFDNPTGAEQIIVAGDDIKSDIQYYVNGKANLMPTSEVFYDPGTKTTYGELKIASGKSKEVYMLAYITNDSAYDAYGRYINLVSIDLFPHYYYQS